MPYPDLNDPATQPLGSVEGSAAYSPMTLIMRYLNSTGTPPNAANIRAALEANARNPGTIPGLRNMQVEDSNPRVPSTRVGTPAPSTADATATGGPFDTGQGTPTTSAAPTDSAVVGPGGGPSTLDIAKAIALGAAGLGAGAYGASRMGPQPGESVPSTVFRPEVVAPGAAGTTPGGVPTPGAGSPPLIEPSAQVTPLDTAVNRAVAEPSYTGDMPRVSQDAIGNYRPGPSTSTADTNRPLPFNSQGPRVAPTEAQRAELGRVRSRLRPRLNLRVP